MNGMEDSASVKKKKRVQLIDYYDRPANVMRRIILKEGVSDDRYQRQRERRDDDEEENQTTVGGRSRSKGAQFLFW